MGRYRHCGGTTNQINVNVRIDNRDKSTSESDPEVDVETIVAPEIMVDTTSKAIAEGNAESTSENITEVNTVDKSPGNCGNN